jgi:hypothetical protein
LPPPTDLIFFNHAMRLAYIPVISASRADGLYPVGVINAAHGGGGLYVAYVVLCSRPDVAKGPAMSLSAWEQQALESIKSALAGSDPELAALLSAFSRLASDEEIPNRETTPAASRRAFRRLRRDRRRSRVRRACRRLGFPGTALLVLWPLITAVLIAVALILNAGGNRGTCTETAAMICVAPASGQPSHQQVTGIP